MRREIRHLLIALVAATGLWTAITGLSVAASGDPVHEATIKVADAQCNAVRNAINAHAGSQMLAILQETQGQGCSVHVRIVGGPPTSTLARLTLAEAATSCYGYWSNWDWYFGPVWIFRDHVNVGMCFDNVPNSSGHAWLNWGPNCYVDTVAGYGSDFDAPYGWCGVYKNYTATAQAGDNYAIWPWINPAAKGYGWLRLQFNPEGLASIYGCYQGVCYTGWLG